MSDAEVEEEIENCPRDKALTIGLSKLLGKRWKKPVPIPLNESRDRYVVGNTNIRTNGVRDLFSSKAWRVFERSVLKLGNKTGLSRLAPAQPAEFGLFVKMIRRTSA